MSKEVEDYLNKMGIEHCYTTPLWPRANGEVKRQNRSLLKSKLVGDFLKTVQNDLKSEEMGPPIHEELAKIVTRLVRHGMLEERLQDKINKYLQPENCESLMKVRVNQLIWDNLSSTIRSQ